MKTRLEFLGTGTSQGVPMIGCDCDVCKSDDPRDRRYRSSAFVQYGGLDILVDAGICGGVAEERVQLCLL